jgi:Family of unknown function (DUF5994)
LAATASTPASLTRLALCERAQSRGGVDGAWWPKSSDLGSELPDLVAVFGLWIGAVNRVVYDPRTAWLPTPARILSGSSMVTVDPYRLVFPYTVYLMGTHARTAVLFVVSPASSSVVARRLLRLVAASTVPQDAELLRQLESEFASSTEPSE